MPTVAPRAAINADGAPKRRWHRIVIALGGPLTHLPHVALYQFRGFPFCSKHVQVTVRI